jgi:hypothetical protein
MLKFKNRKKLEKLYANDLVESLEWHHDIVIWEVCMDGIRGAKQLSDGELLEWYRGMYKK